MIVPCVFLLIRGAALESNSSAVVDFQIVSAPLLDKHFARFASVPEKMCDKPSAVRVPILDVYSSFSLQTPSVFVCLAL